MLPLEFGLYLMGVSYTARHDYKDKPSRMIKTSTVACSCEGEGIVRDI